jgi:predicted Ser/Thr protein kinase
VIGQTLSHYRIVEKLGEGGIGVLYRAHDARLDRDVAIKVLRSDATGDASRRRRLLQEAKAASALNHPHIVTVYDVGRVPVAGRDVDFIAMECIEGRSLAQVMTERPLGVAETLDYAVQIAEALAVAHGAGIVHRDVKPANVMLSDAGRVKVLDFGLAKLIEPVGRYDGPTEAGGGSSTSEPQTRDGALMGTVAYMSPEQADGKPVDTRTDVFSLGTVLFEMLAGRKPFVGDSQVSLLSAILRDPPPPLRSLRRDVPRDLERVVMRCLAKSRDQRYASGGEALLDLEACRARLAARPTGLRAALRRPRAVAAGLGTLLTALAVAGWIWHRGASERRARLALDEIDRLVVASESYDAYWVARQAQPYLPGNARLGRFWKERCFAMSLRTTPPGASVSMKRYRTPNEEWKPIGRTPLEDVSMPIEMLRWRITKEGFEPVDATFSPGRESRVTSFTLDPIGSLPAGMARVAGGPFHFRNHPAVVLDDFWLDRYEVTNRAYREFVDAGGYRKREYWKQPFVKDGRTLSWEEAMASFRDATGRPGPAFWELGAYPDGSGDDPVGGVSWFEAAAFAEFAGKALPTFYHWFKATDIAADFRFADILDFSNFGGRGPVRVGSLGGLTPFGNVDMAGNVREWCATGTDRERYALGGSWSDPAHAYIFEERMPPWSRLAENGFRCARYKAPVAALPAPTREAWRDYSREKPVSDETFESYRRFYAYDRTDLEARVDGAQEFERWRREIVSFRAAYGHERVSAHLFLPRDAKPPYQTVVFYPTGAAFFQRSSESLQMSLFDYVIRSGRAVLHPIYKGTYERRSDDGGLGPDAERDLVVQQVKDFRRALDYLETRPDIDRTRLAVLEVSGFFELYVLALDERLKVGIEHSGGLPGSSLPEEIDPINFAPRVHQPLLLLDGRYDSGFPVDILQKPLLRMLGTPEKDRRHVLVDSGHSIVRSLDRVRETVDWLDRYLGPVENR